MIRKRIWQERRAVGHTFITWTMEGWYLLGFIPLYVRDLNPRGIWGDEVAEAEAVT